MKFILKDSVLHLIAAILTVFFISTTVSAAEVKVIEETDPSFKWFGQWQSDQITGASGGYWKGTSYMPQVNKVEITFSGTGIRLITIKCDHCGIIKVEIDGKQYPDIDTYIEGVATGQLFLKDIAQDLTNAKHTIILSVSDKKNPASTGSVIIVDAVEVTAPTPATFTVSNIIINPSKVGVGKTVTISADITNSGEVAGNYSAALKIDETILETKKVTVTSGETRTVTFSPITKNATGTYTIDVGGQTRAFKVLKSAAFTVTNIKITPNEVEIGRPVTIAADIINTGEAKETYTVSLNINDVEEDSTDVSIEGKATEKATFTVIKNTVGTYNVTVDEQLGTFVVVPPKQPGFTVIFAIVGLLFVVYSYRRRG